MRDRAEPFKQSSEPVVTRRRSEGVTLVVAVTLAVGLGVAAGIWINARLAPTSSAGASRPARALPDARVSAPPEPAAQTSPCDGCETLPLGEATPAHASADKADEAAREKDSEAPTDAAREAAPNAGAAPSRVNEVANREAESRGVTNSEAVATASPDPAASPDSSRPVAWEVSPLPKAGGRAVARANVERGAAQPVERAADRGAQAPSGPCALYTSAGSLRIRVGRAVPLILGGPGVGVRINVSTPNWSELAVIYEGPAAGSNGWIRYSVSSVGHRPGLYTVRVSSPCGSQTIPVTIMP